MKQGVQGTVLYKEGDFDQNGEIKNNGSVYGVQRVIYIYELTSIKAAEMGEGDFVKNIFTDRVDSVVTDENGKFSLKLNEGKYSLFVKENERLYSKLNDKNLFWPVEISRDSVVNIIMEIDYKANY